MNLSQSNLLTVTLIFTWASISLGQTLPDWSETFRLEEDTVRFTANHRENVFNLSRKQLQSQIRKGARHAVTHPVEISELLIPFNSIETIYDPEKFAKLPAVARTFVNLTTPFRSYDQLYDWMGLTRFPEHQNESGPNFIPTNANSRQHRMGVTFFEKHTTRAMTFSCATCHSSDLFGVKVLGMSNRFPRNNEFFIVGKYAMQLGNRQFYKSSFAPSDADLQLYDDSRNAIIHAEMAKPLALGLDTSLAQVSLSLATRENDLYATRNRKAFGFKPDVKLSALPADSKPSVWWTLKYKTKWLSDGSIVSGNPIHTNFLWNEIGRGSDLRKLEKWLSENQNVIDELTTYVFANQAPVYDDFFPNTIDLEKAKRGQNLFRKNCSRCHGHYEKGWDSKQFKSYRDMIKTTQVRYHSVTPVVDVQTDPLRYEGMSELAKQLNHLKISKTMGTIVRAQKGYVPPPLVGIWARWPYFHNNSVPSLFDVLTPDYARPEQYVSGPAKNKDTDFDQRRVGYPSLADVPSEWKESREHYFDTSTNGLRNTGHTKGILLDSKGNEKFTDEQKFDLIEFLKTL